ncbi:MAG: hypothetical protein M3347_03145 [Armatimonadota bacterium]|nr:hypothetical protein [Armatimonadota bacterium]
MSSFEQPSEALASEWAKLQQEWAHCRDEWDDVVAQRFEREFWSRWEETVPGAIDLLRELEEALSEAERVIREE